MRVTAVMAPPTSLTRMMGAICVGAREDGAVFSQVPPWGWAPPQGLRGSALRSDPLEPVVAKNPIDRLYGARRESRALSPGGGTGAFRR